jgi:uncharacterized protein YhbP (UPF0306 family)
VNTRPHKAIETFIQSQTALSMATSTNDLPYCASCFYAYVVEKQALIFKSGKETQHIVAALHNKQVAGTILPDKLVTGSVKGIQFNGVFIEPEGAMLDEARKIYYQKYPFALAFSGELWMIELSSIKFTDNTLGFGKKLNWQRAVEQMT